MFSSLFEQLNLEEQYFDIDKDDYSTENQRKKVCFFFISRNIELHRQLFDWLISFLNALILVSLEHSHQLFYNLLLSNINPTKSRSIYK